MAQRRFSRQTSIIDELASRSGDAKRYAQTLDSKDRSFTDWITVGGVNAPAFQNGWVDFAGAYAPVGFIRDSSGWVHLRGIAKNGVLGTIFTLPAGFRPAYNMLSPWTYSSGGLGLVIINANGTVVANTLVNNSSLAMDGLTFRAEA